MRSRPRRNRVSAGIRRMLSETRLTPADLVLPVFLHEAAEARPISALPGVSRLGIDGVIRQAREALALGVPALAFFPALPEAAKTPGAEAALDPEGLLPRCLRAVKEAVPELVLISDVAMDPYSSDGHDGLVVDGRIVNDPTLPILAGMALVQAEAGADVVAPSDMMDGRVAAIRDRLDAAGRQDVLICSYCVKYASSFYGPFRLALDSAPRAGDKKTYQMDPANGREALRELEADISEGADWLMVKPGLPYLDVLFRLRQRCSLPLAAYHVSGEYAMLRAAAAQGWLDYDSCLLESLTACRRAGADMIFTYGALDAARLLA